MIKNKIKYIFSKKKGYLLLFVMMLVSSVFILSISVFFKNKVSGILVHVFYQKHNNLLFISESISLVKAILSGQGNLIKKNIDDLTNQNVVKNEKNDNEKNDINESLSYFLSLYWLYGNRWIHFDINDTLKKEDRSIHIFLEFNDGKYPLNTLYKQYDLVKEKQNNTSTQDNKEIIIAEEDKKKNIKDEQKDEQYDQESNKKVDEFSEKNSFLKTSKILIEQLVKKVPKFNIICEDKNKKNDSDFLWYSLMNAYDKEGTISSFLQYQKIPKNILFKICDNNEFEEKDIKTQTFKENTSLSSICGISNENCSLWYCSPNFLHIFFHEDFAFSFEQRKSIADSAVTLLKSKHNSNFKVEELWNVLFEKTIKLPYPNDKFKNEYLETLCSTELNFPESITAYISVKVNERRENAIVIFRKNKKYDKNNEKVYRDFDEYLIESVYIQ